MGLDTQDMTSYSDETQLLGYGESDSYGPWIKLRLKDPSALDNFRSQPKGAKLGKRYMLALAEIGDDEQPVPPPKTIKENTELEEVERVVELEKAKKELSEASRAAIMINTPNFKEFAKYHGYDCADSYLKSFCGITSKRELNDPMWGTERKYKKLLSEFRSFVNRGGDPDRVFYT